MIKCDGIPHNCPALGDLKVPRRINRNGSSQRTPITILSHVLGKECGSQTESNPKEGNGRVM